MIVGISGLIGSGKSTVANRLIEKYNFKKDSFATNLKDSVAMIFDWPRDMLEGDTIESRIWRETTDLWWSNKLNIPNFSPRLALQLIGTDALRNHFNSDIWFLTLENRVRKNLNQNIVISDVRFSNEINFIQQQKGILIKVSRGLDPAWFEMAEAANNGDSLALEIMTDDFPDVHFSEWNWIGSEYNFIIHNDGTLEELEIQIDKIVDKILT